MEVHHRNGASAQTESTPLPADWYVAEQCKLRKSKLRKLPRLRLQTLRKRRAVSACHILRAPDPGDDERVRCGDRESGSSMVPLPASRHPHNA